MFRGGGIQIPRPAFDFAIAEVNQDYAHDTCNPSSFVSDAFPRSFHRFVVRILEAEMAAKGASEKRRG
jgi:hypothetical protein